MAIALLLAPANVSWAQLIDDAEDPPVTEEQLAARKLAPPEGARRLVPEHDLWVDREKKRVYIDGRICLRRGQLEMFACPQGTKEHESIVAANTKAQVAHAALLLVGAKVGQPVQFSPEYVPASGTVIEVYVIWKDAEGKQHRVPAQEWIRNTRTKEPMKHNWVFAGSGFWTDETDGKRYYQAEAGDFICVSNFPSATLDLPVESTAANAGLLFEALTEKIPPLGAPVRLELVPKLPEDVKAEGAEAAPAESDAVEKASADEPAGEPSADSADERRS
ncbi:MAG: YdjY domain-containing protein [Pirellulales bacterium]